MDNYEFKGKNNPKIKSCIDDDTLKYYMSKEDLDDPDEFNSFVYSCETMVRKDERYDNYISYLKNLGFNKDVFQSKIDNDKFPDVSIEMHHGPIFNLFEICSIVTDHLLSEGQKVCSYDVADLVLKEHELGNIQIVMGLTKTNHQLVHDGAMFVHMNQSIGDILSFIKKYKKGIKREHLYTLEKYLNLCNKFNATDNDKLVVRKVVKKIKKIIEND